MLLEGTYFDGVNSVGWPVQVTLDGSSIKVAWPDGQRIISLADVAVEPALGSVPRRVHWGATDYLISDDQVSLDSLATHCRAGGVGYYIARLESSFSGVVMAVAITLSALVVLAVYGVPRFSASIAHQLPLAVSAQLAETTLANLATLLRESELPATRKQQLRAYFAQHDLADAPPVAVHFRRTPAFVGPNALTLSGSTVVFTDAIVELMSDDEQLLAVFLHELGHARLRHVEQTLLQSASWAVLLTFVTGDMGGVSELVLTLPFAVGQSAYSREHERQADAFAVAQLQALGIDPEVFAQALEQLERSHREGSEAEPPDAEATDKTNGVNRTLLEFLSSHPITSDRIAAIRAVKAS